MAFDFSKLDYYKLFFDKNNNLIPANLQWFDELDYDQSHFLSGAKFECKRDAMAVIAQLKMSAYGSLLTGLVWNVKGLETAFDNFVGECTHTFEEFFNEEMLVRIIEALGKKLNKAKMCPRFMGD